MMMLEVMLIKPDLPPGLELCLECLASRVELGQHKAAHKYRCHSPALIRLGSSDMS